MCETERPPTCRSKCISALHDKYKHFTCLSGGIHCKPYGVFPYGVFTPYRMVVNPAPTQQARGNGGNPGCRIARLRSALQAPRRKPAGCLCKRHLSCASRFSVWDAPRGKMPLDTAGRTGKAPRTKDARRYRSVAASECAVNHWLKATEHIHHSRKSSAESWLCRFCGGAACS